jgi:hypothetical protein
MFKDKTILIPFIIIGICLLSAIGIGVYKFTRPSRPAYLDSGFHIHADFKVYLNGKAIDFTQAKYQSTEAKHLDGHGNVSEMTEHMARNSKAIEELEAKWLELSTQKENLS